MTDAPSDPRPYMQIAGRIRLKILDGEFPEGFRLPAMRDFAKAEGVAVGTMSKAIGQLQVEGYVRTSPRGTFVANAPSVVPSAAERISRLLRTGSVLSPGETAIIMEAGLVQPPVYVADIFDLDAGDQVVRREWITGRGNVRTGLHVTWYPAQFAALVPDLLSHSRGKAEGMLSRIHEATGRRVTHGRDDVHGRDADAREASNLGLRVGSPILAGAHRFWDDQGIIEYGEWCLPYRMVVSYEYEL